MRDKERKEVLNLLQTYQHLKQVQEMAAEYDKTQFLSKRDVKILKSLVEKERTTCSPTQEGSSTRPTESRQ